MSALNKRRRSSSGKTESTLDQEMKLFVINKLKNDKVRTIDSPSYDRDFVKVVKDYPNAEVSKLAIDPTILRLIQFVLRYLGEAINNLFKIFIPEFINYSFNTTAAEKRKRIAIYDDYVKKLKDEKFEGNPCLFAYPGLAVLYNLLDLEQNALLFSKPDLTNSYDRHILDAMSSRRISKFIKWYLITVYSDKVVFKPSETSVYTKGLKSLLNENQTKI